MMICDKLIACCATLATDAGVSSSALLSFASLPAGPVFVDAYGNQVTTSCVSTGSGIDCAGQSIHINTASTPVSDASNWLLEIWTASAFVPDVSAGPFRIVSGAAEYYGAGNVLLATSLPITPSAGPNHIAIGVAAGRARLWHNGAVAFYSPSLGLAGDATSIEIGPFSGVITDVRVSNSNVYGVVGQFPITPNPSPLGVV